MTYLVMENHLSYSLVLDEAGHFLQVANLGYEIGQTVEQVVRVGKKPKSNALTLRLTGAAGAIAACFALVFSLYMNNLSAPFASIYMSINPAVRMDVREDGRVVGLSPVNDDGALLIDGYKWKQKDMTLVADELADRAIEMGFLSDGGTVSIDIDSPDELWFQETGISFRQNLDEHLSERISVTIEVGHHDNGHDPDNAPPNVPPATITPDDHDDDWDDIRDDNGDDNDDGDDRDDGDDHDSDDDDREEYDDD